MRYRFIDDHKKAWPVTLMCGVLGVSRSGYDHWSTRALNHRRLANVVLDRQIREIFTNHQQRYGTPRITATLHEEGVMCSRNRVARRIGIMGLKAIQAKKSK